MKKTYLLLLLAVLLIALPFACGKSPVGTVWIDTDGNGIADALAVDADKDGQPDLDESGNFKIVQGTPSKKTVEAFHKADDWASGIFSTAGNVAGTLGGGFVGAILIGLAAAWRSNKFGRIFLNTVTTVQAARKRLKAQGLGDALEIVDEALSDQLPETIKMVKDVKDKFSIPSVG